MKKITLSAALLLGTITIGANGVLAAQTDSKTTDGNVGFTSPTDGLKLIEAANLDFGNHEISASDQTYTSETDTKTTVQDIRGTLEGWTLQVSQSEQFKKGLDELKNAQITLDEAVLDKNSTATANVKKAVVLKPTGESTVIMDANSGQGNGIATEDFNTGKASLSVPGATVKVAGQYKTTLIWSLMDSVKNN